MADFGQVVSNLQRQVGFASAKAQEAAQAVHGLGADVASVRRELERQAREYQNLHGAMQGLSGSGGGKLGNGNVSEHVRYIESIPGRRFEYDFIVTIPIVANSIQQNQGTKTVTQDGPFVAVARYATFQSAAQFAVTDPTTGLAATFQGRSYGRFRPVHSAWDLGDAGAGVFQPATPPAFPGTGSPYYAAASNHSSFRSMEFDGLIEFLNAGSGYFRSNDPVPSAFYSESINSVFQLGALDFFERGESLQWKATPTHVNNPPAGNLQGYGAGGSYPFLASQYDVHEGIKDTLIAGQTTDPVTRLYDGFLIVGFHGFRIVQPPGPVRLT